MYTKTRIINPYSEQNSLRELQEETGIFKLNVWNIVNKFKEWKEYNVYQIPEEKKSLSYKDLDILLSEIEKKFKDKCREIINFTENFNK